MPKNTKVLKNVFYGAGTRLVIMILGIVIPRLLIVSYGSEMNGLLSTITQIFTYLALIEAGIGTSAVNALYKPIANKDNEEINRVLGESRRYYRKVSVFYALAVIAFSVVFPLVAKTGIDKPLIFAIIFLQGASAFVNYFFSAIYMQFLTADGKKYVNENFSLLTYVITSFAKIALITLGFSVLAVQIAHFVISVLKILLLYIYCKKKYPWMRFDFSKDKKYLQERGAFVTHEISNTIFNNTDVLIISIFCSFEAASVYTVYNLVFTSLNTILTTVNSGLGFVLGQAQHNDKEKLLLKYDTYRILYCWAVFSIFTTAMILIVPFVKLYTAGVSDVDYLVAGLPILFTAINILSGVRAVAALLITVSGHASKTQSRSIIEAVINIMASVIMVYFFGLRGVLYGTVIALLYRSNDIIIYANLKILKRKPIKEYINILVCGALLALIYMFMQKIELNIENLPQFFLYASVIFIAVIIIFAILTVVINPQLIKNIKTVFINKAN